MASGLKNLALDLRGFCQPAFSERGTLPTRVERLDFDPENCSKKSYLRTDTVCGNGTAHLSA